MGINIDEYPENRDWTKRTWDLSPYKSKLFMAQIGGEEGLERFRRTVLYKFAIAQGLIVNDEWQGSNA